MKKGGYFMNNSPVFYQLPPELIAGIQTKIDSFNQGRTVQNGKYAISTATPYRPYYALWRLFSDNSTPLFIRTLAMTFDVAAERTFTLLQNCNVKVEIVDNSYFEAYYGLTDDLMPFGKYRGKRLAEIYYIDPSYVLWLANKFEVSTKRYERIVELAKQFSTVHFELTAQKRKISSVSRFVGQIGEILREQYLTVLNVRLQVDRYKPDFYVDQQVLAADRDGNRFTLLIKAKGKSMSPEILSCYTRKISIQEVLHLASAKIMSHYESRGVQYTRLGYVKLINQK